MTAGPVRPAIPRLGWMAGGAWAGACAGEHVSWSLWCGEGLTAWAWAGLVVCVAAVVWSRRRPALRAAVAVTLAGLALGVAASGLQGAAWQRQGRLVGDCGARTWSGTVEEDPTPGAYGTSVQVVVSGGPLDGGRVRVRWPADSPVPDLGRMVRFSAVLKPLPPGELWARRTAQSGVCATGSAWKAEVGGWRPGPVGWLHRWRCETVELLAGVEGSGGDLLTGILLGDRRRLKGTEAEEDFRVLGLSHLVAVSGTHLGIACGAVAGLGHLLRLRRRWLVLLTMGAGVAYTVVTGLPLSAVRALAMMLAAGVAMLVGRRADPAASLAGAVLLVLAVEPWSVFDIGLRLSVLAVASLLAFGALVAEWASEALPAAAHRLGQVIALTCVAQIATMPLVSSAFGMVSVLAPLANAYAAPLVSLALCLGLVAALIGSVLPVLGLLVARGAGAVLGVAAWLSSGLADCPGAAVVTSSSALLVVGVVTAAVAVWAIWPRPRSRTSARALAVGAVVCTVLAAWGPPPARRAEVVVLDVGQADAILVRDGGRTMLVDAASDPTVLRQALARHGVRRIDVLVLTHAHDDHIGGVAGLSGVCSVGWVGIPGVGRPCVDEDARWLGPETEIRTLAAGAAWSIGSTKVRVLWPPERSPVELHTNDTSVVLHCATGALDIVLTGDAEGASQRGMAERGSIEPIEVLKVPHHGSRNGLTPEGLAAWQPEVALVSVGTGNRFGHPSAETIELLRAESVRTVRTDLLGDLTVEIGHTGFRVRTQRHGGADVVRARILSVQDRVCAPAARCAVQEIDSRGRCGGQRPGGAQTGLSDLWLRGVAPRERAPPLARSRERRGRPRLQLRCVRRGARRGVIDHQRGQYVAVRV